MIAGCDERCTENERKAFRRGFADSMNAAREQYDAIKSDNGHLKNDWQKLCEALRIPLDSSGGRARDAIRDLKHARCSKFRVTDGKREGVCYSFWDSFDVWWDDGDNFTSIVELSIYGIRKVKS